jgi:alcohol dehydrogenase class IV
MVSRFEFATAQRVVFGPGVVREAGALAAALGRRPLVVTGRDPGRSRPVLEALQAQGLRPALVAAAGEPKVEEARRGTALARAEQADLVLACGGGSALDLGKAIAALAAQEGDLMDYLEVVGQGRPLERAALPMIAVPTTAGTGSEATRNAVLASGAHGVKASLRHASMLPRVALVDPELTLGLPPELTANTGLDALTQLIEPYLSSRSNPLTDALCLEGVRRSARSLERAWASGQDLEARFDLALASLLGGMALANAGLGAVHGLAAPLGGRFPVPHGAACAVLLPHVLRANLAKCPPGHPVHARFAELARLLTGDPAAAPGDGVDWVAGLVARLGIRTLGRYGVTAAALPDVAERALAANAMKANPVPLDRAGLMEILARAL